MLPTFLSSLLFLTSLIQVENVELSLGINRSSYKLYHNVNASEWQETLTEWQVGGEIGIANFIPNIGLKVRGAKVKYYTPIEYSYEYIPLTLCSSFNLLPFLKFDWLKISAETGFGYYLWKVLWINEVIELPNGDAMDERDIGFVGGLTFQLRPYKNIAVEYATRYNYIFSSNLEKYGFFDKDEKIWENGVGVKFIIPL